MKTIRDRVKKLMDEKKTMEQVIAANPLDGYVKPGNNANNIIRIVYNSILKSAK